MGYHAVWKQTLRTLGMEKLIKSLNSCFFYSIIESLLASELRESSYGFSLLNEALNQFFKETFSMVRFTESTQPKSVWPGKFFRVSRGR